MARKPNRVIGESQPGDIASRLAAQVESGQNPPGIIIESDSNDGAESWRCGGDLAQAAEAAWLDLISGGDPVHREALGLHLARQQSELDGDSRHPLLSLLAQAVALRGLQAAYCDTAVAEGPKRGLNQRQLSQLQRRQERAQRALGSDPTLGHGPADSRAWVWTGCGTKHTH